MNQLVNLKKQINDANKTMKIAAPILEHTNPEMKHVAKGLNLAQQHLVPMIDQTNKAIQKGNELQQQCIEKVQNVANTQMQKANELIQNSQSMLQSTLKENQNLIVGTAGTVIAAGVALTTQVVGVPQQVGGEPKPVVDAPKPVVQESKQRGQNIEKQYETPTQDGSNIQERQSIQTPQNKQSEQNQIQPKSEQNQIQPKSESNQIQAKIKQYIKKVTGKQVNSRIEYLCLLSQKLKDNNDINYSQHAKDVLKNEMWKGAYQERRIQSHQMFIQYMSKVSEFIFEYLTIIETVFQQIKMRYKSSNHSFEMLLNYCNQLSMQLDYFVTYGFVQPNQSFLSRLFTNQAKIQKIKKNQENTLPEVQQQFHQELCQNFTKLETEYKTQLQSINVLKQMLKDEIREKIILIQQRDQQRMSDYLMQLQGQRNITFEAIESFYRNFISYETLYSSNVEAAFDGTTATKDLYDEEYKMYYYLRNLLKQQQQFGLFTTYMLKEISEFEYLRIEFVQKAFNQLNQELGKYFQYPKIVDFTSPNILAQAKSAFDINQLLNIDQLAIIKKYAVIPQNQNINTDIYTSFATGFTVPMPLFNESPLILKKYNIERDVAWERSLSFGKDYVKTCFIITVDGFLLFYDTDWIDQNLDEPLSCNNFMAINDLTIKESSTDDRVIKLAVTKQGKLFNSSKKQILRMNDQMEKESLKLLLTQFK